MPKSTDTITKPGSLTATLPGAMCRWLGVILFVALFAVPSVSHAADCRSLFGKRKYADAATCFINEAKKIGANPNETQKLRKGRMLRNAALSLDKAAKSSNASSAAAYRIKAITVLDQYLNQQLYPDNAMKEATTKLRTKFKSQIGYATLRLVTSNPQAKACITAPGFRKCQTGPFWDIKLLPKTYQVSVTYPTNPPVTQTKVFTAVARTQKPLVFTPPVKKISLLSVVTGDVRATIVLKGDKLKAPLTHVGASWSKQLPPGDYNLMVIYPDQAPIKREIKLLMGRPEVQIFNRPGPPVLIVNTTPINAQVFINGKYSGNTGLRLKLKPGIINLEIKRGCYQVIKRTLQIKANQEYPVSEILKRDPAYLSWKTSKKGGAGTAVGWTMLAAGIVFAGVGGAMFGVASGKNNDAMQRRAYDFEGYQQLAGENNTFVGIGNLGVLVGGLTVVGGIVALVVSRPKSKTDISCKVPLKDDE